MSFNTENKIEVSGADLRLMIKTAYDLSRPQGMGFLHAREGDLDDETVDRILSAGDKQIIVSMDYIHGRACKFRIFCNTETGRLYINDKWYDHTDYDLRELLRRCRIADDLPVRKPKHEPTYEAETPDVKPRYRAIAGAPVLDESGTRIVAKWSVSIELNGPYLQWSNLPQGFRASRADRPIIEAAVRAGMRCIFGAEGGPVQVWKMISADDPFAFEGGSLFIPADQTPTEKLAAAFELVAAAPEAEALGFGANFLSDIARNIRSRANWERDRAVRSLK